MPPKNHPKWYFPIRLEVLIPRTPLSTVFTPFDPKHKKHKRIMFFVTVYEQFCKICLCLTFTCRYKIQFFDLCNVLMQFQLGFLTHQLHNYNTYLSLHLYFIGNFKLKKGIVSFCVVINILESPNFDGVTFDLLTFANKTNIF